MERERKKRFQTPRSVYMTSIVTGVLGTPDTPCVSQIRFNKDECGIRLTHPHRCKSIFNSRLVLFLCLVSQMGQAQNEKETTISPTCSSLPVNEYERVYFSAN